MTQDEKRRQSLYAVDGDTLYNRLRSDRPQYAGTYDKQLTDLYGKITNRPAFEYDVTKDPLYQQYKGQYIQQGKLAMRDTMGQAAGLTGGYGSSYGQQVGQQAYDAYLQKLGDVVPDLYSAAYGRWNDEGDRLMQQYAMLGAQRDNEYNRYRNELSDWENERAYQTQLENQEYNRRIQAENQAYTRAMNEEQQAYARAQQEYQNRMNEENQAYTRAQNEQKAATSAMQNNYANLYKLIGAAGYNPSDAELAAAGMSREAADALRTEYLRSNGLLATEPVYYYGGGGGGNGNGDEEGNENGDGNKQRLSAEELSRAERNLRLAYTNEDRYKIISGLSVGLDSLADDQLAQLKDAINNPYATGKSGGSTRPERDQKIFVTNIR